MPTTTATYSSRIRKQQGSLAGVFLAIIMMICLTIGSLAVDISHVVTVKGELQDAVDAAAIAGATDLGTNYSNADANAVTVASQNTADGKTVRTQPPNVTVSSVSIAPTVDASGSTQVTAQMVIGHVLARLFGRLSETLSATAQADYFPIINNLGANQFFPIAVSIDDTSVGPALNTLSLNSPINIQIQPSGGNACWTSGSTTHPSTTVLRAAVDIALGLRSPNASESPAMTADGSSAIALTQGLHNGVKLYEPPYPALMSARPFLVFPVIAGSKPYNQSRTLLGFISVKVSSVTYSSGSLVVDGTIVKGVVQGVAGELPEAGASDPSDSLSAMSPATVKLVR